MGSLNHKTTTLMRTHKVDEQEEGLEDLHTVIVRTI